MMPVKETFFTNCEPAFLSKDMQLRSSETMHVDVYKIERVVHQESS